MAVYLSNGSHKLFPLFGNSRYLFIFVSRINHENVISYHSFNFLSVREPEGFSVWNGPPFSNNQPNVKLEKVPCTSATFSSDGSTLMVIKSDCVISIYECSNLKEIRSFQVPAVAAAALSPCGTYLQTFQKSSSPQEKNVVLWKIETGDPVYNQFQKNMTKATWYVQQGVKNRKFESLGGDGDLCTYVHIFCCKF